MGNSRPWRRRRHALASVEDQKVSQISRGTSLFYLTFLPFSLGSGRESLEVYKDPGDTVPGRLVLTRIMLSESIRKVFCATSVEARSGLALKDVDVKHCRGGEI